MCSYQPVPEGGADDLRQRLHAVVPGEGGGAVALRGDGRAEPAGGAWGGGEAPDQYWYH